MATPEELSREELERRAALGMLELDDDELLTRSTQAEPTYKIGEPDIDEDWADVERVAAYLDRPWYQRAIEKVREYGEPVLPEYPETFATPGEAVQGEMAARQRFEETLRQAKIDKSLEEGIPVLETGPGGKLTMREPEPYKPLDIRPESLEEAVDQAHWGLAALSVADPTMTTDLVDAALYKMMGDAETAREVIYWSAGGLGAGALAIKLAKLAKVRKMRRSLQSEFEAKGYPQEAAEEASGRVFNLAAARWEQKIRGDLPVSSQYGRGRGQGSVVDLERTPSGLRAAESDSPMDRAYARMKQADIEENYGASNIKPRYSERSDMTESEALRWLLEVRDGYQKRLSTGTRNEAVRIKKLDDVYENFERTGDLNRLFDEIELTDVLPIEDLERRIPSLSIARKKQGGPDIRKMVEEDPAAREEFMDFLAKEERELQARRAAKPPVLREVEAPAAAKPPAAMDRAHARMKSLYVDEEIIQPSKPGFVEWDPHGLAESELEELESMFDMRKNWETMPGQASKIKKLDKIYEQFELDKDLNKFSRRLAELERKPSAVRAPDDSPVAIVKSYDPVPWSGMDDQEILQQGWHKMVEEPAPRVAEPPVLREVEPSSALDRFNEELVALRELSNKANFHPDLDDKLSELDMMNEMRHSWLKSPEDAWRLKELENVYESFEKSGNLKKFSNDLISLEKTTPEQYKYRQSRLARRAGKPSPSQAPPAPDAPAAGSKPPWQMTRAEFEATGEELMHGTDVPFDRFMSKVAKDRYGKTMGRKKESLGRFYFTEQPNVARSMSDATRAGGHRQVDFDKWAQQQGEDWIHSNDPVWDELLEELHSDVRKDMKRKPGRVLAYIDADKGPDLIKVNDPSEIPKMAWAEQYDIRLYEPERWPRVIKTNVYGRTLDLTDPKNVPDDLAKLLKKEGRFDPSKGGYQHEFSTALVKYARENNYGKIKVNDVYESGFKSTIGIEEYIGYGVDPHHAFVEKAIREGKDVPEEVLRRYPDLYALKWGTPKPPRGPSGGGGSGAPAAGVVEVATDASVAGAKTPDEVEEAARLWEKMGVSSPYFKRRFSGSKVVDDAGEPLPVFTVRQRVDSTN